MKEVNAKGLTHFEHMEKTVKNQKCHPRDMSHGGRCLNCGWVFDHTEENTCETQPKIQN